MHSAKITFLIILLITLSGCTVQETKQITIQKTDGSNITIKAEIADTQSEQQKGLMYRTKLCTNCGMIFLFNKEQTLTFWMKNTQIPLDMIFANENGTIVNIEEAEPCKQDPCRTYISKEPAKYVLELNKGYCKEKGIKTNDIVIII